MYPNDDCNWTLESFSGIKLRIQYANIVHCLHPLIELNYDDLRI